MAGLLDFLQSASNAAASNISGPVDGLAWLLGKAGMPVQNPVGGSAWMERMGLTKPVQQSGASLAGETFGLAAPIAAAAKAPQIARGLLSLDDAAKAQIGRQMEGYMQKSGLMPAATAWHGSPHKFDKFDSSKIGTGEGAQAYGHGLYLAEDQGVAKSYQDLNPSTLAAPIRAFKGTELTPGTPEYHAATLLDSMSLTQARKTVANWIKTADPRMAREAEGWAKTLETLNAAASKSDFKQLKNTGNLYKVDLPDEMIARMLDWDKPLSQQAPEVQKIVQDRLRDLSVKRFANPALALQYKQLQRGDMTGQDLFRMFGDGGKGADSAAAWREAGIPGIRYLDGNSRGAGAGTSNYVVFPGEEGLLKILERNGQGLK